MSRSARSRTAGQIGYAGTAAPRGRRGPGSSWRRPCDPAKQTTGTAATGRIEGPVGEATRCVHPGQGKDTTLGAERSSLPEWRARGW
jgi:hypothetical protein